jgi:type II secretory ATPase GspE/PulE/Tfp pilus assembly ATPase PilB-like protein
MNTRISIASEPAAGQPFEALLKRATTRDPQFATDFVNAVLRLARDEAASDVHLDPSTDSIQLRWRLDGVLQPLCSLPNAVAPNIVARLKVLAGLLTYETSLPQEGRIRDEALQVEVRVSTFPTLYGERVVLRMLGASSQSLQSLDELGLPGEVLSEIKRQLVATSGAILIAGPAGSGKTTTAYACLRQIIAQSGAGRSAASLEDPVEVAVDGVAQSQVNLAAEFDMATGLRSLLRLDPEVIFIGEMRDRETAEIAMQAALTGQLVITTFHAGDCAEAMHRLAEIGIPQYAMRNAVRFILAQRLVRRLCSCAQPGDANRDARAVGLEVERCWFPRGCESCRATGYRGRALIAQWQSVESGGAEATPVCGEGLWRSATALVQDGTTSAAEVVRVLGLRRKP